VPAADGRPRVRPQRRAFLIAAGGGLAAFLLVAVLVRAGAFDGVDQSIVNLFADHRQGPFTGFALALDRLDSWWLLPLLIVALVGGLWWSGRMMQALYLAVTVGAALVLNPLLKLAFQRRPPGPGSAATDAAAYAFPSGHTTTAAAAATALAVIFWPTRWRWPMLAAAVVFSLTMAVSRVYLGVHWPSDVAGGLALGFTIAAAVRAVLPWPSPEEAADAKGEQPSAAGADRGDGSPGIDVVFLDWGNTLMVDNGMREGPMKDWATVEAEPGAQEALLHLHARYRLVVATNADDSPAYFVRLALARVALDDHIDDVVTSAEVGDRKPNYAFFRAALLREGERGLPLDPRRAVMVGDGTTNDIAGAQRAGMRTIWYNPTKRRYPADAQPPDAVVKRLADLPAAVDRLAGVTAPKRSRRERRADADAAATAAAAAAARDLRAATLAEDSAASAAAAVGAVPAATAAPPDASGTRSATPPGGD